MPLSWAKQDIENRLWSRGGRHTRVNAFFAAIVGLLLTGGFYASMLGFRNTTLAAMFLRQDSYMIPLAIVFFCSWALAILAVKSRKIALQRRALAIGVVPTSHDFVLSSASVDAVIENIYQAVDDPKHFILFNRIVIALSNLRNLGRVSDVDDILHSQASNDEAAMDTSYLLVASFVWAIPVLGFIGTVVGLSRAIGAFGDVVSSASDVSQITGALKPVVAGLSTAFETTLEALVGALVVQLFMIYLKKSEEEFLESCSDYCIRNVVNRLRIMPFEREHQ
jgi:biopolymer transport protein ExbB/TolQ